MTFLNKYINYPNELQAQGLTTNGLTTANGTQTPNQESLKIAIKDIVDFMVELGLSIVPTDGELDVNNILDIPDLALMATQYNNINGGQVYSYGFKKFAFTDSLQETYPIYITLRFGLVNITNKYGNPKFTNRFAFNINVSVSNDNLVFFTETKLCNIWTHNRWADNPRVDYISDFTNSIGIYTGDRLYFNIYPSKFTAFQSFTSTYNLDARSGYFNFYIERSEKYTKICPLSLYNDTGNNGNYSYNTTISKSFSVYSNIDPNINFISNQSCIIPYINDLVINNGDAVSFKSIDVDPKTNIAYSNENLMVTYSHLVSHNTTTEIEVDGELHTYYVHKPENLKNLLYIYSPKISLLIRLD